MTSLSVVFSGPPEQRHIIKITAMQPISAVLPSVAGKFKPALEAASIRLTLNKKPVDINSPFRLANIPAGSILHISSYQLAAQAATPAQPAEPTPAQPAQPSPPVQHTAPACAPGAGDTQMAAEPPVRPLTCTAPPVRPGGPPPQFASGGPGPGHVLSNTLAPDAPPRPLTCTAPPVRPGGPPPQFASGGPGPGQAPGAGPPVRPLTCTAPPVIPGGPPPQYPSLAAQQAAAQAAHPTPHPAATTAPEPAQSTADSGPAPMDTDADVTQPAATPPAQTEAAAGAQAPGGGLDLQQLSRMLLWQPARDAVLTTEATLQAQQQAQRDAEAAAMHAERAAAGTDAAGMDEDDSFYELTPEDLAGIMRSAEAKKKEEAQGLKTQAMREAEERAKMAALGPVALRLLFPDGVVLQAAFKASDTLQTVMGVVRSVLSDSSTPVTLFITPPKQVLKDLTVTLYRVGLVPAAVVHVQLQQSAGPTLSVLKPDVAATLVSTIKIDQLLPGQHPKTESKDDPAAAAAARDARRESKIAAAAAALMGGGRGGAAGGSGGAAGGAAGASGGGPQNYSVGTGKLPKWMQQRK